MNILKRPGWSHYELIEEARAGAGASVVGKEKFVRAMAGTQWEGKEMLQSPQHELYRFVGQVILSDDTLAQHFPSVTNPRQLRSGSFSDVAPEVLEALRDRLDEIYSNDEKFIEILRMLHAGRRAATSQELEVKGVADTREKHRYWQKAMGEPTDESTPEAEGPLAKEEDLTPQELANVNRAQFQVVFAPVYAKIPLQSGEIVADVMEDYPELMDAAMGSQDIFDFIEKLADMVTSGEPVAEVAEEIYDALKNKLVKGAETVVDNAASGQGMPAELGAYFAGKREEASKQSSKQAAERAAEKSAEASAKHAAETGELVPDKNWHMMSKQEQRQSKAIADEVAAAAKLWLYNKGMLDPEEEKKFLKDLENEKERYESGKMLAGTQQKFLSKMKSMQQGAQSKKTFPELDESLPESTKLSAKQIDMMLLEQRRRNAQYHAIMEERYGR